MRRSSQVLVCLVGLAGCKTVSNEVRERPAATAAVSESVARTAAPIPDASAPAVTEAPLAWGTRPGTKGPLYPVVDGMCVHGEIWPTQGSALYTYGNGTGPWSRGRLATLARIVDDGLDTTVSDNTNAGAWQELAPMGVVGTWPAPLLMYSSDQGNGRMRDWPTLWMHGDRGWSVLASHREREAPGYSRPVLFGGHAVASCDQYKDGDTVSISTLKSWPLVKDAPAILGLALLGRARFIVRELVANDTSLFAVGSAETGEGATYDAKSALRILTGGKVSEVRLPAGDLRVLGTRPTLVLSLGQTQLIRLDDGKPTTLTPKLAAGARIESGGVSPGGDIWLMTSKKTVLVVKAKTETFDESRLPAPSAPGAKEAVQHWPTSGGLLAGVDVDDPYAVGEGGSLFHHVAGAWQEVELPPPPFATTGKYQAQAIVVPAKGELYVNAGYAEKGVGWKTVERYRAVLRNKRPKEVLRCNEPASGVDYSSGAGFMSFPPIATDACTTPFVILLRIGWGVTTKDAVYPYDRKSDYPSIREAIKGMPSLGAAVDLVEVESGDQRYVGARVPSVAAGRELAEAVVKKKITGYIETRPEIVCGQPKEARVLHVDVATGKLANPVHAH